MSEHTPGPWLKEPGDTIICIRSTAENESYRIADVGGLPYWKKFSGTDKANADLIAAAPDMLAALYEIESTLASHNLSRKHEGHACPWDFGEGFGGSLDKVRAAIAKAEGRHE